MRVSLPRNIRLISAIPLALISGLLSSAAAASTVSYTAELPSGDVRVVSDPEHSRIIIGPGTDRGGGEYYRLADPGSPAIPYRVVRLLLPDGEEFVRFDAAAGPGVVISESFTPDIATAPRDPDIAPAAEPPLLAGGPDGGLFPARLARYLGTGYWHGRAIASFAVFPFQVEGARLTLRERVTLSIETRPREDRRTVVRPQRMSPGRTEELRRRLSALVSNPRGANGPSPAVLGPAAADTPTGPFQPSPAPSLEGSPVEYLIVTTDELAAAYQRLADWKTAKGVPTVVRTTEWIQATQRRGVDQQETVRFFIREAYQKWGVTWVLLGGDTPEIPARFCYNTYYYGGRYLPVDLYYAGLDGSWNADHDNVWGEPPLGFESDEVDLYAEVYVGRLPTSTVSNVDVMIDKIINYTTPVDPSYTDKMMFLAEVLFPYPWDPPTPIDVNGAETTEFVIGSTPEINSMNIVRAYETEYLYPGSIHESREQAIDSLNAGFNLVYHVGHGYRFNLHVGDANVVIADADTLSNHDRYSNIYMLNCTAAAYHYDCLSEHFLENASGGAVSIVGANDSAFPDAATYYMDEYTRLLFRHGVVRIGETFARSRLPRTPLATVSDNPDRWTHYIYTLLADPEMALWTGPMETLQVTHAAAVGMGVNPIQIDATASGGPAESVLVCLWKELDDYQYGLTDAGGTITFDFACESPGSLSVVATGPNHARYQGWITVDPEPAAYVVCAGVTVNDTTGGFRRGNGDGVIDAGETVEFVPLLTNTGNTASDITILKLRSVSPFVTFTDTASYVGPIQPGDTVTAPDWWRLEFSPAAPDETAVEFTLTLSQLGGSDWTGSFTRLVHAPQLEFVSNRRDDSPPVGNGNGTIENGEEFLLYFSVKNYGTGTAAGLTAEIIDLGVGFVFVDSVDTYVDIGPMTSLENTVGFRLSETNTAANNYLEITITDSFDRVTTKTVEFREPIAPGNLQFDTSIGENRIYMWWDASPNPDVDRYRVYRSTTQGGPYTAATTDLVTHTIFTDMDLAPSTRYYYVVTAVDASGNESLYSPEASATTTPPMLYGWPNSLPEESANSPAVGDVDGDGDLEVIVGNDLMYAWHHDGQELRDGDNNLQSWGVFSDQGHDFIGPAALARLDGKPGLDIVAAAYTSLEVYCFDYTGAVFPGWPRPTSNSVRASVVVGDLDGDNVFEIIAIDQSAVMYAWHVDGQEVRDGDGNPGTDGVFYRFPDTGWWHYQAPAVCDIDDDGTDEIIVGTQDSTLYVLNGDGSAAPGWPVALGDFAGGGVAVGDIDDDGDLEIVATVKNTSSIRAYSHDGNQLWSRFAHQVQFFNPAPALADLTGDGKLETIFPGTNGKLYIFDYQGTKLPGWPINYSTTTHTQASPVVADVSGDGNPDIIVGDEDKLMTAWDVGGNLLDGFPLTAQNAFRGTPAATDLDGDGDIEILAVSYDRTVYAWDFEQPYDPDACPWPEFMANPHRNGRIGYVIPTGVEEEPATIARAGLEQNMPNPFNPVTTIVFYMPAGAARRSTLTIYDVTGARVRTLVDKVLPTGRHEVRWDGTNDRGNRVGTGVYFYRLAMPGFSDARKMVLLK